MYRNLPIGAHLVTPRKGYSHHGIYVGNGRVVHYAGFCKGWLQRGPVEETSVAKFARGYPVEVRAHAQGPYAPGEVARRARNRVGEDCYALLTHNCEHFCAWCVTGESRSEQVERLLTWPPRALRRLLTALGSLGGFAAARAPHRESLGQVV